LNDVSSLPLASSGAMKILILQGYLRSGGTERHF
jgi:hypothetical protein